MVTGIANQETVWHRQLSGDVLVRNIQINGWSEPGVKLGQFSQNGRLWGEVAGTTVSLYRSINPDGTFTATEKVLEGAGAVDALITLTEQNSSGLADSYLRYTGSGTFDIVFASATEDDVIKMIPGQENQLVWPAIKAAMQSPGRLETMLNDALRKINDRLLRELESANGGIFFLNSDNEAESNFYTIDAMGRYELAIIATPEQLIRLQVWQVLRDAAELFLGSNEWALVTEKTYADKLLVEWQNLRLWIDFTADREQDGNKRVSPVAYKPKVK